MARQTCTAGGRSRGKEPYLPEEGGLNEVRGMGSSYGDERLTGRSPITDGAGDEFLADRRFRLEE